MGFMASTRDALRYWDLEVDAAMPAVVSGIYSGTAMLNRLLERKGRRVGLILTGGMEDMLRLERGIQTYLGYPYSDRLHVATHYHNEPLVPRSRIRGVRERIDCFGEVAIPLYEDEARAAISELRDAGVEGLVVCLLYSYRNSEHEDRIAELASELAPELPVFLSSRPVSAAARLPAPELDADRGLRRRAQPRPAPARTGGDPRGRRRLRPAHHGRARRHDLGGRARARAHADLGADRRGDRSEVSGRPVGRHGRATRREHPLHRHRRHELRHRPDHRR